MKYDLGRRDLFQRRRKASGALDNGDCCLLLLVSGFLVYVIFLRTCRGGGMADATDLKSVDRKVVWVRLPPPSPLLISLFQSFAVRFPPGCVNSVMGLGARMTLR